MSETTITLAEPATTGPCSRCGVHSCFCAMCAKLKRGKRLCGKCLRADEALEKLARATEAAKAS